jgi:hypothetical protein
MGSCPFDVLGAGHVESERRHRGDAWRDNGRQGAYGGGTGCSLNASTTGKAGGDGAAGIVIVTEHYG